MMNGLGIFLFSLMQGVIIYLKIETKTSTSIESASQRNPHANNDILNQKYFGPDLRALNNSLIMV